MSCQFTEDGAQSQYPNITVTFDGGNICVRAIVIRLNEATITIEQDYPVGTSDLDIAQDLMGQIKGDGNYDSVLEQAQKRSINIARLLQEAFVGV